MTTIRKITPDGQPQFPCWLFNFVQKHNGLWEHSNWLHVQHDYKANPFHYSHWRSDQPDAPEDRPDETSGHTVAPDGKPWPSLLPQPPADAAQRIAEKITCRHIRAGVTSPIDTVETCLDCGTRIECTPLIDTWPK